MENICSNAGVEVCCCYKISFISECEYITSLTIYYTLEARLKKLII